MRARHSNVPSMAALLLAALVPGAPALAQDTGEFRASSEDALPPSIITDEPLDQVTITGASAELAERVQAALGAVEGQPVDWLRLQNGLERVRALDGVGSATFNVVRSSNPTRTTLEVTVVPKDESPERPRFPILHQDDKSLFTLIGNGAFGAYSDTRPWFGNSAVFTQRSPVATDPPTGRRASWVETALEVGAGGITRIGGSPIYVYGAATGMLSAAAGQDLFTDRARSLVRVEKLYGGLIIGRQGVTRTANLSIGRQNFNLADGFLISQFSGSANAGPRPGLFLNPRIAFDLAAVGDFRLDRWRLRAFYLNPDELEPFESRTEYAGANLTFTPATGTRIGMTFIDIVRSDSRLRRPDGSSIAREGIKTIALEGRIQDPFGAKGLWLQGEYARQWRGDSMRAWAGYTTVGWRSVQGWQPSFSYRFFAASGDDPSERRYGRYEPMLSGGLAEWVQGVNFKKIIGNTNVNVHRLRGTAKPSENLNLTLDFFDFEARERNNLGGSPALGTLSSRNLGREVTLRADWFLGRHVNFLIVGSHAVPGDAIDAAAGGNARPWTTLQISAFWRL